MRWKYRLLSHENGVYLYAYARENAEREGTIRYDVNTDNVEMITPCSNDEKYKTAFEAALVHFYTVVREGFPEEITVSCG